MMTPKLKLVLFESGKINFYGARSKKDIRTAINLMWPVLSKHRMKWDAGPDFIVGEAGMTVDLRKNGKHNQNKFLRMISKLQ